MRTKHRKITGTTMKKTLRSPELMTGFKGHGKQKLPNLSRTEMGLKSGWNQKFPSLSLMNLNGLTAGSKRYIMGNHFSSDALDL